MIQLFQSIGIYVFGFGGAILSTSLILSRLFNPTAWLAKEVTLPAQAPDKPATGLTASMEEWLGITRKPAPHVNAVSGVTMQAWDKGLAKL